LVAGLGPSGRSERPGFGWYFGGDAFFNLWAITAYGDFELAERTLVFLRDRQREDGKMMHELSQGAAYIPWFEEFPYGYYHADTTPLYIVAVRDYVRASGNAAFAREFWPSVRKAFEYCLSADENDDGLMDNTLAGLGAVETGALRTDEILTDVYLASVWTEAKRAMRDLAAALEEPEPETRTLPDVLSEAFVHENGISFALVASGGAQNEDTTWPAFGLWRGLFRSEAALDDLASSRLGSDWGARMLSRESSLYDHKSYNNGGVWPFLTGYAALALYANGRSQAGWSYVEGLKELTFLHARGYVTEILSGDRLVPIDASVPHQLFSTAGFVSPLLRGLVGYEPGRLGPRPPPSWDRFRVENLRHASGGFSFDWERTRGDDEDQVRVALEGDIGELEVSVELPSGIETWTPEPGRGVREHVFRFTPSVEIEPMHEPLRAGDRSRRLRVLHETHEGDTYRARLEARSGSRHRLRARIPGEVVSITNGERNGEWIDVAFPDGESDKEFSIVELVVRLRRSASEQ
jgi:glycogen debranching enzyme